MKFNIWTFLVALLLAALTVFWIIPAILEWQRKKQVHEEKMIDKAIELKKVNELQANKPKNRFKDRILEFLGRTVTEIVPALASKMIGGA